MWDERIRLVRTFADSITDRDLEAALEVCHPEIEFPSLMAQLEARPYTGHAGIRRYFRDIDATWEEWRVEVEELMAAPDGRVVIVMSTHMRGKESGAILSERTGHIWTLRDSKLLRNQPFREPEEALREVGHR